MWRVCSTTHTVLQIWNAKQGHALDAPAQCIAVQTTPKTQRASRQKAVGGSHTSYHDIKHLHTGPLHPQDPPEACVTYSFRPCSFCICYRHVAGLPRGVVLPGITRTSLTSSSSTTGSGGSTGGSGTGSSSSSSSSTLHLNTCSTDALVELQRHLKVRGITWLLESICHGISVGLAAQQQVLHSLREYPSNLACNGHTRPSDCDVQRI